MVGSGPLSTDGLLGWLTRGGLTAWGQAAPACGATPVILQATQPNVFSEQQEQWLGDAMADQLDRFSKPVKNPELNGYLETIGTRLLKALPPTQLKFHFVLVESAEVNGFSLAGGRVYLTRKLVASAHSEDEVAGVIAHEMGHILSHQFAIETTADLRKLLNVTSVGDRADVYAKYQMLIDARQKLNHQSRDDEDAKQDQADRVAVYASAAAGYRPQAYAEFWDRSFFVDGKTGSRFSDFFGSTTPTQKRLRKIRGIIAELPQGCGSTVKQVDAQAFTTWQQAVQENRAAGTTQQASHDGVRLVSEVQLKPALRSSLDRLRFSRDGKYVLAQDESSIFVLSREPFQEMFRFDAEGALAADFTPDSKEIAFATPGLHIERWNVSERKLVSAHEVVAKQDCLQVLLSPDARTIGCVFAPRLAGMFSFALLDAGTGNPVYMKEFWYAPDLPLHYILDMRAEYNDHSDLMPYSYSSDGNTLLLGGGSTRLAFDLQTRTPIKLSGVLTSSEYGTSYCFMSDDRIAAVNDSFPKYSGIFSFPAGKQLEQLTFKLPEMHNATKSSYVLTPGEGDTVVALGDIRGNKFVVGTRSAAMDAYGQIFVSETLDGSLMLMKLGSKDVKGAKHATLSTSPLPFGRSVRLSTDGRYLAYSSRTRAAVWDTASGNEKVLMRGMRGAWWTADDQLLGEFPPREKTPRMIREVTVQPVAAKDMTFKLQDHEDLESGHLLEWASGTKNNWTFTARSPLDHTLQWTKTFTAGRPSYTTNAGDADLLLSYALDSAQARERLRETPLQDQVKAVKERSKGLLVEVVDSATGTTRTQVVIGLPGEYDGVDGLNRVDDLLYVTSRDNRTVVYSMKTGLEMRKFFGMVAAADPRSGRVCELNRQDELLVLDRAGKETAHLVMGSPVRFATFTGDGKTLTVLTADQMVHRYAVGAE